MGLFVLQEEEQEEEQEPEQEEQEVQDVEDVEDVEEESIETWTGRACTCDCEGGSPSGIPTFTVPTPITSVAPPLPSSRFMKCMPGEPLT